MKFILLIVVFTTLIFKSDQAIVENLVFNTDLPINSYKIFNYNSQNFLSVFTGLKNQKKWLMFDPNGKLVFSKENITGDEQYLYKDQIYFLDNKLSSFSISDFKITNYNIPDDDYQKYLLTEYENQTLFIASNKNRIDIYDTKSFKLVHKIEFNKEVKVQRFRFHKGMIIYKNKENGIAVFNLKENKKKWEFDAGSSGGYFLGIKMGTFPNDVSQFLIEEDRDTFLIMSTWFGYLYKFDFKSGKVLLEKEKFKGTGNNAGLISYFELIDMNKDGIKDIVAGSVDNNVYCINGKDFSIIWEYDTDNEIQLPLSFYDINGDNTPEVFGVNDYDNILFILDGKNGKLIKDKSIKDWKELNQTSITLSDFSGNSKLDLLVKRNPKKLQLYEMDEIRVPKNKILWDPKK
ncbi:MAG: hypothetical protein ABI638_13785 [Ignavibacteriota bacterium]